MTPDPKQKRAAAKASAKKEKDKGSTASAPAAPVVEDQVVVVGGGPGEGDASTPSTAPAPAPPEPEQDPVLALLDAMDEGCGDLIAVFDNVTLCFPPERNVFKVLWGFFHEAFSECIGSLCHVAGFTSNSDILAVLGWSIDYYSRMAALGLEDEGEGTRDGGREMDGGVSGAMQWSKQRGASRHAGTTQLHSALWSA